jgi:hypothetical protein
MMQKTRASQNKTIMNLIPLLLFLLVIAIMGSLSLADGNGAGFNTIPVDVSADGRFILVTDDSFDGLVLINVETEKEVVITDGQNSGYYATISPHNQYVCFKTFKPQKDGFVQQANLYDIANNRTIALTEWVDQVGNPAVAPDGTIAVTQGNQLMYFDKEIKLTEQTNLGQYINLISFSPDSSQIVYSDQNQQLILVKRSDKQKKIITSGNSCFWGPKFSPQGDKILASSLSGDVVLTDVTGEKLEIAGRGHALGWVNNDTVSYLEKTINEKEGRVTKSTLVLRNFRDNTQKRIDLNQGDAHVAVKGGNTAIVRSDKVESGAIGWQYFLIKKKINSPSFIKQNAKNKISPKPKDASSSSVSRTTPITALEEEVSPKSVVNETSRVYLSGVPYIHQVYDTPNEFNGHSACGASSALMAIQYYNILPAHPVTVSVPSSHTSNFGWYVCNVYTKGRTFNIYSEDPSGNSFAGGFGYITQNNWEDTKTHMAEYISYHGRSSAVDWSPGWSKFKTDIDNNHPLVVLNSLTSSGHYITAIGYLKNQHTAIFNDPYGDKNDGYKNYQGSFSYYDWPGYNNGYQNLVTVHCFIYCR